jgi:hypothetical protein
MHKHALKMFLLSGAVLAAMSCAAPASAAVCAVLEDSTGTRIEVFDTGTANVLRCHSKEKIIVTPCPPQNQQPCTPTTTIIPPVEAICSEGFAVCVKDSFAVGALGDTVFNLKRSETCSVFLLELNPDPKFGANKPIFTALEPEADPDPETGAPLFNLDDLPLGTVVNVQVVNLPDGKNIGVQTTFQHRVGTCKLCKIRKIFSTSGKQTITQVKEIDVPCNPGIFSQLAGPGGSRTAVVSDINGAFITVSSTGNTGANPAGADERFFERSGAGSIEADNLLAELKDCHRGSLTAARIDNRDGGLGSDRALEVFLSFRTSSSSGVTIDAARGVDKFLTFCIDIE